ncbi:hypothetical protein GCM10011515_02100 [Tsuneonella deserti]|uniref:Integron gene cassette protein n=1 Tax=Tsuneonella deserti TaxID=2035528 RepID=A0ABQ1RY65_9SPHN|nr:hypothetical protein [Tsuneonella deserti]GGD86026.1 hypothetical protein GCM10011515_02100 [Tsuneonella deserti]
MVKAVDRTEAAAHDAARVDRRKLDWRRRMSDNIAYALLVYTALQIVVTVHALKSGSSSVLPYLALVVLVAAIIPACRAFEGRWMGISDEAAADRAYAPAYRRDQALLWLLAIGLPFVLTGIFRLLASVI